MSFNFESVLDWVRKKNTEQKLIAGESLMYKKGLEQLPHWWKVCFIKDTARHKF